jgi:hypothetical protein
MRSLWVKLTSYLNGLKPSFKIFLVLAGYVGAIVGAGLAYYLYTLATQTPDRQTYGAMYEFGDWIFFCFVWAALSLVPTFLALFFLRPYEKFWNALAVIVMALAVTGPLFEIANMVVFKMEINNHAGASLSGMSVLGSVVSFFGLARLASAPFLIFGYLISAVVTPFRVPRRRFLIGAVIEMLLIIYVVIHLLLTHQFA